MSKKIIFNDNEVVWNEDVESAQDWRKQDLNRLLEGLCRGTFGAGPTIPGTVEGAAIVSGVELVKNTTSLVVDISPGTAVFGFGGTDLAQENIFQLATALEATRLTLPVAHPTLYRYDIIEVSASQITYNETRKVLTSIGPTRRLVDTVVPKVKENKLNFRVRSSASVTLGNLFMPSLQPDPAWLPLYAIRVTPAALTTENLIAYDLRLWLQNFQVGGRLNSVADGWRSRPEMFRTTTTSLFTSQSKVTIKGYTAPIGFYAGTPFGASRFGINVNSERPVGVTYAVDQWYYLYAVRPNLNCGFVALTLSTVGPSNGTGLPNGQQIGLPLPAPWPADATATGQYLGAIRLYSTGGGNFAIRDFYQAGDYVALGSVLDIVNPPGANHTNKFIDGAPVPGAVTTATVNPGVLGYALVPSHVRMVKTIWHIEIGGSPVAVTIMTKDNFILTTFNISANTRTNVTLDIPLPFDNTTEVKYRISGGSSTVVAEILGYYEGLS